MRARIQNSPGRGGRAYNSYMGHDQVNLLGDRGPNKPGGRTSGTSNKGVLGGGEGPSSDLAAITGKG